MFERVLITGGAGFIGSHLAEHSLKKGREVVVVDNLRRTGFNIKYLKEKYKGLEFVMGDVSNPEVFEGLMDDIDLVYHCAAQVAVTTSLVSPRLDYETNADGTFNLCEALRKSKSEAPIVYCSTNKVYGDLELPVVKGKTRYRYKGIKGIGESYPLETNCPYGGSKIIGEYILDTFNHSFGLKSVKARMSCIYGTRQFGNEDQGWVAWFTIAALLGKPITIYGDGKQVRDILYISDQNEAFELLARKIKRTSGQAYNLGGGPDNTVSLFELLETIEELTGRRSEVSHGDWRMGDQKVYVTDVSKIKRLGWKPKVGCRDGVEKLVEWTNNNKNLFA
ncbi:MAG: GDP-mannose 4,6-dehydratase [Candidatus Altiarchaeota archaeon]|nr:GDP-mannose 4,6-dehydratase [Candidatus Altiarchaeota archaeon]